MKTIKILNLYACLGGNLYKWDEVAKENNIKLEVTSVELDEDLANLYQERFPNHNVVVADAHQYLLDHYKEFDFIWSSPPCPTHSRIRHQKAHYHQDTDIDYPVVYADMKLYQEIILLKHYFKGSYLVENVSPYYIPLIPAKKRGRHLYWSNFNLPNDLNNRKSPVIGGASYSEVKAFSDFHDFDFYKYKGKQSRIKICRNLVDYEAGKTIFETYLGVFNKKQTIQKTLF